MAYRLVGHAVFSIDPEFSQILSVVRSNDNRQIVSVKPVLLKPRHDQSNIVIGEPHTVIIKVDKMLRIAPCLQASGMLRPTTEGLVIPHIDFIGAVRADVPQMFLKNFIRNPVVRQRLILKSALFPLRGAVRRMRVPVMDVKKPVLHLPVPF